MAHIQNVLNEQISSLFVQERQYITYKRDPRLGEHPKDIMIGPQSGRIRGNSLNDVTVNTNPQTSKVIGNGVPDIRWPTPCTSNNMPDIRWPTYRMY